MKKIISLLLITVLLLSTAALAAENEIRVVVNGCEVVTDVAPVIIDGRTMLPVRAVCEAIGAKVSFDNETRTVTAKGYDYTLVTKIDDKNIKLYLGDGTEGECIESESDVAPMIIGGRTMLPLRALCEALDFKVSWDEKTKTVNAEQTVFAEKGEDGGVALDRSLVKIHGRFLIDEGKVVSSQPASGIEMRFKGTELSLSLKTDKEAYIHVFTDGNEELFFNYEDDNRTYLAAGENKITLAENLTDGIHTVKILKANEGAFNKITWNAAYTNGEILAPVIAKTKKIQFVGDSITCSASSLNFPENANGSAQGIKYEDSLHSYACYVGRAFDADIELFAKSGLSMYNCMSEDPPRYEKIDPFAGIGDKWDHTNFEPDLIVQFNWINEYVGKVQRDGIKPEKIKEIYVDMIKMFRRDHPNSKLMMVSRSDQKEFIGILDSAIEEYGKENDASWIKVLTYDKSTLVNPGHPHPEGQANIAKEFIPQIEEFMGWTAEK